MVVVAVVVRVVVTAALGVAVANRRQELIIIITIEKTEAGLERPLYPRNRCRITNTCYTIL